MNQELTLTIILPIQHEHSYFTLHNHKQVYDKYMKKFSSSIGQICNTSHCKEGEHCFYILELNSLAIIVNTMHVGNAVRVKMRPYIVL